MAKAESKSKIVWCFCYCGCGGWETVYRGGYFWSGQICGAGPHHITTKHAYMGFHVGVAKSKKERDQIVRDNYHKYPKMPRLTWHSCPCGQQCSRMTVCLKGQRFWAQSYGFLRTAVVFASHRGQVLDVMKQKELDQYVRALARKRRQPKVRRAHDSGLARAYIWGATNRSPGH